MAITQRRMSEELQGSHNWPPPTGLPTRWSTSDRSSSTLDEAVVDFLSIVCAPASAIVVDDGAAPQLAALVALRDRGVVSTDVRGACVFGWRFPSSRRRHSHDSLTHDVLCCTS